MLRHFRRSAWGRSVARRALFAGSLVLGLGGCLVDIGGFGGTMAMARGISDCGVVVGHAAAPDERPHAFRWVSGKPLVDLNGSFEESTAAAVNDRGVAVGVATIAGQTHAVSWAPDGRATVLGLGPGSEATDITASGTIVGGRTGPSGQTVAFLRDGTTGAVVDLPPAFPGVAHHATAVNERGDVVGYATPDRHAPILWAAPDHRPVVLSERPGLTVPADINERGDIAGTQFAIRISSTALVWRAGTHEEVELPAPAGVHGTVAAGITDDGLVVGHTFLYYPTTYRAVRWTLDGGQPTDLGALGGGSASAVAVNDAGVAAGWADVEETAPWGSHIRHAVRFPAPAGRPPGGPAACGPVSP